MAVLGDRAKNTGGLPAVFNRDHGIGTTFAGTIVDAKVRQRRDDDNQPLTWSDGNPQEELVIAIQTDRRDPDNPDDEGHRGFYIKWWGQQRRAVLAALEQAGAEDIEIGGWWSGTRSGQGPQPADRRFSPPWEYTFAYRPPARTAGLAQASNPPPAQPHQAPADPWGAPAQQAPPPPPAAPAPARPDPGAITAARAMIAAGQPDEVIRAAFPVISPELMAALRNAATVG